VRRLKGRREGARINRRREGREGGREGVTYLVQEVEAFSGIVGGSEEVQKVLQQAQELNLRGGGREGGGVAVSQQDTHR